MILADRSITDQRRPDRDAMARIANLGMAAALLFPDLVKICLRRLREERSHLETLRSSFDDSRSQRSRISLSSAVNALVTVPFAPIILLGVGADKPKQLCATHSSIGRGSKCWLARHDAGC